MRVSNIGFLFFKNDSLGGLVAKVVRSLRTTTEGLGCLFVENDNFERLVA